MNLALYLVQANEPFDLEGLIGQLVRYGVIALFLFGPLLKKIFGDKKNAPVKRRQVRRPQPTPEVILDEPDEFEDDWTILPRVDPIAREENPQPTWIEEPTAMPTRLPTGDLMHSSFDEHEVPLDLPVVKRKGARRGWRSALILREVLGPPVGLRSQSADRAPFG